MKAILEFNLNDYDDEMSHKRVIKATDMAICLFEIAYNLKKTIENRLENLDISELDKTSVLDMVFEEIAKELENNNINLEELIN